MSGPPSNLDRGGRGIYPNHCPAAGRDSTGERPSAAIKVVGCTRTNLGDLGEVRVEIASNSVWRVADHLGQPTVGEQDTRHQVEYRLSSHIPASDIQGSRSRAHSPITMTPDM